MKVIADVLHTVPNTGALPSLCYSVGDWPDITIHALSSSILHPETVQEVGRGWGWSRPAQIWIYGHLHWIPSGYVCCLDMNPEYSSPSELRTALWCGGTPVSKDTWRQGAGLSVSAWHPVWGRGWAGGRRGWGQAGRQAARS